MCTRIVWELDFKENELEEAEIALFAQDSVGNVWHMGEYPEEYDEKAGTSSSSPVTCARAAKASATTAAYAR